jgi:hypothetical protein
VLHTTRVCGHEKNKRGRVKTLFSPRDAPSGCEGWALPVTLSKPPGVKVTAVAFRLGPQGRNQFSVCEFRVANCTGLATIREALERTIFVLR